MVSWILIFYLIFCIYSNTTENSFFKIKSLHDIKIAMAKKFMYVHLSSLEKMLYQILIVSKSAKS
jgi:hypothetical protein